MPRKHTPIRFAWLWLLAALGCGTVLEDPNVDFGDARPLGSWKPATAQTTFETEGLPPTPNSFTPGAAGSPALGAAPATTRPNTPATTPGSPGTKPEAAAGSPATGSAGAAASSRPAASAGSAAPSGNESEPAPDAPTEAETSGVTQLELSYNTESLGGRYAPKNIGAVWVTDSSGKLVKSLELWARVRLRYLLGYAAARGSARPDITATATLTSHKPHTASWDLTDSTGAAVPPGKYTLHAEVTDSHMDGKTISVPFDTSGGPTTIEPPSSAGFPSMKLTLK